MPVHTLRLTPISTFTLESVHAFSLKSVSVSLALVTVGFNFVKRFRQGNPLLEIFFLDPQSVKTDRSRSQQLNRNMSWLEPGPTSCTLKRKRKKEEKKGKKKKKGLHKIANTRHAQNRVQELCESRGGRTGLSVLMSLTVYVDVKQH